MKGIAVESYKNDTIYSSKPITPISMTEKKFINEKDG